MKVTGVTRASPSLSHTEGFNVHSQELWTVRREAVMDVEARTLFLLLRRDLQNA